MLSYVKYRLAFTLLEMRPGQALYQSKWDTEKKRKKTKTMKKKGKPPDGKMGKWSIMKLALI